MSKRTTYAKLQNDLMIAQAYDIGRLARSHADLQELSMNAFMGSGVVITITDLSGSVRVKPTVIADGLSSESIAALQADIARHHAMRVALNLIK